MGFVPGPGVEPNGEPVEPKGDGFVGLNPRWGLLRPVGFGALGLFPGEFCPAGLGP